MITLSELMGANSTSEIPLTAQQQLVELLVKVNKVREVWGKPMTVTSGFRSMQHHVDIYRTKALRAGKPFSQLQVPLGSRHLYGQAADFADDGSLYKWLHEHPEVMEMADVYGELNTQGWVHLQSVPFNSYRAGGTRWFVA